MSLTLIAAAGFQPGIEVDQTGLNIASQSSRYFSEVDRVLLNKTGEVRGRARSTKPSVEVTLQGEVAGSTGAMAFSFLTACTLANDTDLFGRDTGILLMGEVTESQEREGWRSVSMNLRADPGITAV